MALNTYRVICFDCIGAEHDRDDCPRYVGTSDSNGAPYCANCGHRGEIHPVHVRRYSPRVEALVQQMTDAHNSSQHVGLERGICAACDFGGAS